ncbi:MAG: hypothetical protein DSY90_09615 [Deltaproteobacteria bacterium]|nr:MAG: hypothetical protein DSY90_09615 [Deltaproteobacteria bacterium]
MPSNNKGFTLIEVLIALGIAGVVLAAAYSIFMVQQNSYKRQEQITEMQQNLRAAMTFMAREIRMAGADPLSTGAASIISADSHTLRFSSDVSGGQSDGIDNDHDGSIDEADEERFSDGDVDDSGENISYTFTDSDSDGTPDRIDRNTGGGLQPLAENIDALDFVYLDGNGAVMTAPIDTGAISAIQMTIIARTERGFPNYTDNTAYQNLQGQTILDKSANPDNYRRLMASTTLKLRNINP